VKYTRQRAVCMVSSRTHQWRGIAENADHYL